MAGDFPLRRLTLKDAGAASAVGNSVDWDHSPKVWQHFIRWSEQGAYGITDWRSGELLATGLSIRYAQQRAWIAMVITHRRYQGLGFARRIMETMIDKLQKREIPEIMLDASSFGRPLYEKLGFRALYDVPYWQTVLPEQRLPDPKVKTIRRATLDDLGKITAFDHVTFGAPREHVLKTFIEEYRVWVDMRDGEVHGFLGAMIPKRRAASIGGWQHHTPDGAAALLATALRDLRGYAVSVSPPEASLNSHVESILKTYHFASTGGCTRMILGDVEPLEDRSRLYSIMAYGLG